MIPIQQKNLLTGRWRKLVEPQKEATFHIQLVSTLRWCLRPDVVWRHVPNGEYRDAKTAAKLKAFGILPGSADLEFFYRNAAGTPCILFLELKLPGRKCSEAQMVFALAVKLLGAEYEVACSIDKAIGVIGKRGLIRSNVEVCGRRW
jgi:hypothetical protein